MFFKKISIDKITKHSNKQAKRKYIFAAIQFLTHELKSVKMLELSIKMYLCYLDILYILKLFLIIRHLLFEAP